MIRSAIAASTVILGLASMPAFAAEGLSGQSEPQPQPRQMSDAQLDKVAAGAPLVVVNDVLDLNNNNVAVAVPVNASVAVGVLGNAGSIANQLPGNINQRP